MQQGLREAARVLHPEPDVPALTGGDLDRTVDLNIEEAERCYRELAECSDSSHWLTGAPGTALV